MGVGLSLPDQSTPFWQSPALTKGAKALDAGRTRGNPPAFTEHPALQTDSPAGERHHTVSVWPMAFKCSGPALRLHLHLEMHNIIHRIWTQVSMLFLKEGSKN